MGTIIVTTWAMVSINNRGLDDLKQEIRDLKDEVTKRLDNIEALLREHGERITRLEERTSPIHR
jgi:ATP-dependent DNA ligase